MTHHLRRRVRQGIHVSVLAALTCAGLPPAEAAGPAQRTPRPRPIEAALDRLHWSAAETPTIVVVAERPERVSLLAEGWMVHNNDGTARPTIYIAGWSELYRDALANPDGLKGIIRLAGVLAHERYHIRVGPDEEMAYAEQLIVLQELHAAPLEVTNVQRALEAVRRQNRARPLR